MVSFFYVAADSSGPLSMASSVCKDSAICKARTLGFRTERRLLPLAPFPWIAGFAVGGGGNPSERSAMRTSANCLSHWRFSCRFSRSKAASCRARSRRGPRGAGSQAVTSPMRARRSS
jgi:hypothetical protein